MKQFICQVESFKLQINQKQLIENDGERIQVEALQSGAQAIKREVTKLLKPGIDKKKAEYDAAKKELKSITCVADEVIMRCKSMKLDYQNRLKRIEMEKQILLENERIRKMESDSPVHEQGKTMKPGQSPLAKKMYTICRFEVTDIALIPRDYLVPNEKLLNLMARESRIDIPGIKWISEVRIR